MLVQAPFAAEAVLTQLLDDLDVYHGAPVGLQIVARKFEEEKILAIAKIVCAALATSREREGGNG